MIDVFTPDQRLTGDAARQALRAENRMNLRKASIAALQTAAQADASAMIAAAQQAAADAVAQARIDAAEIRAAAEARLDELRLQAQQDMGAELARELASIAAHLTEVALAALDKVVGDIGADALARAAVLHVMRSHPQIAASRLRVAQGSAAALGDLPVDVVADASLAAGDAVLETAQGLVDLGAGAQLKALHAAIGAPTALVQTARGAA